MTSLKDSLDSLNYKYKEVAPELIVVYNFLKDSEIELVLNKIKKLSQSDWEEHYMTGVSDLAQRKYNRTDIENLVKEGLVEITTNWVDKNAGLEYDISGPITKRVEEIFSFSSDLLFDGVGTIQRQYDGEKLVEHVDNHADPSISHAVIMYINDDYSGGELFFSNLKIQMTPPAKSMVIFPSGEEYLHGVNAPGPGPERYVLPSFVRHVKK